MWWLMYLTWLWFDVNPRGFLKNPLPSSVSVCSLVRGNWIRNQRMWANSQPGSNASPGHPLSQALTFIIALPRVFYICWLIPLCSHCTVRALISDPGLFIFITIGPIKVLNSSLLNEWENKIWVIEQCLGFVSLMGRKQLRTGNSSVLFYMYFYMYYMPKEKKGCSIHLFWPIYHKSLLFLSLFWHL